jgi:hypothetical protein
LSNDSLPPVLSRAPYRQVCWETIWVFGGFGAYIFALYGKTLSGWWAFDDSQILRSAFLNSPWAYFFMPEVWKAFQPANLNPLILWSFDIDLAFFGLAPKGFYAHQLIILWLIAFLTFQLLRPWVKTFWAVAGPLLFICSAPVTNSVYQLMTRHYLEGLLLSIIALHCFLIGLRKNRLIWACLGGLCYFFAASAKEVYVVLPLILILIPSDGKLRKRVVYTLPFFVVTGFYVFWRRYMLGTWVGGYGQKLDWLSLYQGIFRIPSIIFGDSLLGVFAFCITTLVFLWAVWNASDLRLWFVGSLLLLLGPIAPAVNISDPHRLLLFFTWAMSVGLVLCLGKCSFAFGRLKPICMLLAAIIGVPVFSCGMALRPGLESVCNAYEVHGRFILEQDSEQVLLPFSAYGNWFTAGLVWLRIHMLNERPPKVVYDEIDLGRLKGAVQNIFRFDPSAGDLQKVAGGIESICSNWSQKLRKRPISVRMDYEDGVVSWNFGPYISGRYSIITYGENGSKIRLPRSGFRRRDMAKPLVFRVRYDAPEGWIAYSDLFQFDGLTLTPIETFRKTGS